MLCRTTEHFVYAVILIDFIPASDSVVYNDSTFTSNTQGNHVFARFLVSSQHKSVSISILFSLHGRAFNTQLIGTSLRCDTSTSC